jgi:hypothetical protein
LLSNDYLNQQGGSVYPDLTVSLLVVDLPGRTLDDLASNLRNGTAPGFELISDGPLVVNGTPGYQAEYHLTQNLKGGGKAEFTGDSVVVPAGQGRFLLLEMFASDANYAAGRAIAEHFASSVKVLNP